ncbi:MAG: hypothetical protein C5B60_01815 [Chloroflexi bacterium]|nr:MAG: hypothetical protein C5B60_01815 [Chloroflexota bacterium]
MPQNSQATNTTNSTETAVRTTADPVEVEQLDFVGTRLEASITPRSFVTRQWAQDWPKNKPGGTWQAIGRVGGVATGVEMRESRDKKYPPSLAIIGRFQAITLDGEVRAASALFLPPRASSYVAAAFRDGALSADLDIEFGIEAMPDSVAGYKYTVTAFDTPHDGETDRRVKEIMARQEARAVRRLTQAAEQTGLIEAQPDVPHTPKSGDSF